MIVELICRYLVVVMMDLSDRWMLRKRCSILYMQVMRLYMLLLNNQTMQCLYFAEGRGGISMWDERTGNISAQWSPHDDRINSIDFNSLNSNIITTSSTDGTACIWDLRSNDADKFKSLKTIGHKRAVHSAYFSPSGRSLVTTR